MSKQPASKKATTVPATATVITDRKTLRANARKSIEDGGKHPQGDLQLGGAERGQCPGVGLPERPEELPGNFAPMGGEAQQRLALGGNRRGGESGARGSDDVHQKYPSRFFFSIDPDSS